jgi:hypothetical protein
VDELYKAAEGEEQNNLTVQQLAANQAAAQGNYELLGAMYGLTADQVDRLMNRGKYAPVVYYDDSGYGGTPKAQPKKYVGYGNTTVYDYSDGKSSNPGAPTTLSLQQWANRYQYK